MATAADIQKAIDAGRRSAEIVIKARDGILMQRTAAITKVHAQRTLRLNISPVRAPEPTPPPPPPGGAARIAMAAPNLGPQGHSTLIAEGDSWFDYPGDDVLRILEDQHGYEVESVAHMGDKVEEMAYTGGQLDKLTRLIEKVIRDGRKPRAILLSGGGNDLAGDEFGLLLNHANSPVRGLNQSIVSGVIDERIKLAYAKIIAQVTFVCESRVNARLPLLVHGYDYPIPDGRGFMGGWWLLPGPWLEPGFREKGFEDLKERISITKTLIDRFNNMLMDLATSRGMEHVHYVDLRNTLKVSDIEDEYVPDWANELHPTPSGFEKVTQKFVNVLDGLPV
jgi:hypothetical protein